ncbi:MAG: DUF1587 domain-containing protein [Sphingopyxis sp.]|nr:DUF1587 domain-containing protein [Sphingopyxis sp.]
MIGCLLAVGSAVRVIAAEADAAAVFETYCFDCHDDGTRKGNLSLEKLDLKNPVRDSEAWERVVRKLNHRQMPPVGEPRPDDATYDQIVAQLVAPLDAAARAQPNPGRTETLRRLNRVEYENTLRDLLGVRTELAELLPEDGKAHGSEIGLTVTGTVGIDRVFADFVVENPLGGAQQPRRFGAVSAGGHFTPASASIACMIEEHARTSAITATSHAGQVAADQGIRSGLCPRNPSELAERLENEPGMREGLKRRAGTEARVSILIRDFMGKPARAKGFEHRELLVGWAVLSHNLWILARLEKAEVEDEIEEKIPEAA